MCYKPLPKKNYKGFRFKIYLRRGNDRWQTKDLFDGITESTGIYITIFEKDERRITTVTNAVGECAVGTKATSEVVDTVIGRKEEFFSDNVDVNGTPFFGYYMPLTDSGGAVTGMVFAGKSREFGGRFVGAFMDNCAGSGSAERAGIQENGKLAAVGGKLSQNDLSG